MNDNCSELSLDESRKEICEIDEAMAELFEKRMKAAARIADYKRKNNLPVKDKAREDYLIEKNCSYIQSDEMKEYYKKFLRQVIDISCEYQAARNGEKL